MRRIYSQSPLGSFASCRLCTSNVIVLACITIFTGAFSGCASASADRTAAEKLSVVPSVIDFKGVVVGQKNSQTVKVTNSSSDSISLKSLHVSGTGFSLRSVKAPVVLPPGSHLSLRVVFDPPAAVDESGALVIASTDLKVPIRIPL